MSIAKEGDMLRHVEYQLHGDDTASHEGWVETDKLLSRLRAGWITVYHDPRGEATSSFVQSRYILWIRRVGATDESHNTDQ